MSAQARPVGSVDPQGQCDGSSSSKDEFMVVEPSIKALMRRAMGKKNGKKHQVMRTKIVSALLVGNSSTATALSANTNMVMSAAQFPEFTTWAGVYDEMRVLGGIMYFYCSGNLTTQLAGDSQPPPAVFGVNYDPANGPNSFSTVLTLSDHGPLLFCPSLCIQPDGHPIHPAYFKFKMPSPEVLVNGSQSPGSGWFTLDSSNTTTMFQACVYIGAGNTGCANQFNFSIILDVEFRMRV